MGKPIFVGPDPLPAMGSGLDCLCAESRGFTPLPEVSLREVGHPLSTLGMLQLAEVQAQLRQRKGPVVVWKSSAAIENLAAGLPVALANSPARTARQLENKVYFSQAAAAAGIPVPEAATGPAGPELAAGSDRFGPPWVFQLAHGFSGRETYLARDREELAGLLGRFAGRASRVARYVPGPSVTVSGVCAPSGVGIGDPCLQLTGVPELTPYPLGSCGNDFHSPVPSSEEVMRVARLTGEWLRQRGHLGIFGVDLVVGEDGRCWCLEVNPRLVASVPLWSLSAREQPAFGLLAQHLSCFEDGPGAPGPQFHCDWSQVVVYRSSEAGPSGGTLPSGRLARGAPRRLSELQPLSVAGPAPGEVAVVTRSGTGQGKELGRIIFQGPALQGGVMVPWLRELVTELRGRLDGEVATTVSPPPPRR